MKIGIITDVHANLPAFRKAMELFRKESCSKIFHVGDLIGIGPYPKECIDLAFSTPNLECIMGNHDFWYGNGLPDPKPAWMSDQEIEHRKWTHDQIGPAFRNQVRLWPFSLDYSPSPFLTINFRHYSLNQNQDWFRKIIKKPNARDLDELFDDVESEIIFYGHHHPISDITGNSRYINVGSAGCNSKSEVRLGLLEIDHDDYNFRQFSVPYNDGGLMDEFDKRQVPERDFIRQTFIIRK